MVYGRGHEVVYRLAQLPNQRHHTWMWFRAAGANAFVGELYA